MHFINALLSPARLSIRQGDAIANMASQNKTTNHLDLYGDSLYPFQGLAESVRIQAIKPVDFRLPATQPSHLSLGQLPGRDDSPFDRFVKGEFPVEIIP